MMKAIHKLRAMLARRAFFILLLGVASLMVGCATTEPENESSRPWNTPKSWENGLPAGMFEGR